MKITALARGTGVVATAGALLLGGTLATAPVAHAVGSERCTKNVTNHWRTVNNLADATVRSGPGTMYKKRYQLYFGDHFKAYCSARNQYGNLWYYGMDPLKRKGWIYADRTGKGRY
ncbi:hypothetical protein [Streptomyces xinghaiensis]|uniref:hypothetical protein n=1 Tax=Streptomyces xinghaiensis TaxID=1038928 RepID=UPI00068502F8|nr:hypothetical protein [Streptomyces xinghaiensis]MZE80900.1 hypothetical protein [Streptomyces sp. SID5475]